ncbi:MAG: glycosyltransferase [Nanoarchaeota archaeon]|nr:glycosyltransferase [Nanoarchaeota archaeon]
MNILIIKTGALGDVVRTSFIAQALKDKYRTKNVNIFWLTDKRAAPLFINNPYIRRVIKEEDKKELVNFHFNIVINLEESEELCKFASSLVYEEIIGFIYDNGKILPTPAAKEWFDMSALGKKPQNDILKKRNKKTHRQIISEILGIKNYEKYEPFLRLSLMQRKIAEDFLRRHNLSRTDLIIGINTGSADRWPKQLSIEKTAKLINNLYGKFNTRILLFGGPEEIKRNGEIMKLAKAPVIDTGCGNDLVEFPALISVCTLLITSDSLGLHISLALKRKTIVLLGPTSSSEIDVYGLGEKVIARSDCLCCYKKDCKSMEKISIEEILEKVKDILYQKITLLITAYNEPNISKAIEAAINQKTKYKYEIIISAPDNETLSIAEEYSHKYNNITVMQDPGKGKSFALNLAFSKIKTDILILTDGDIYLGESSIEEITNLFLNPEIGCVSGKPVPQENKSTKFGYWANFLFYAAHRIRKNAYNKSSFIECSGYLFAFRKKHIKKIPVNVAEDTIIPYFLWQKGYKIGYAEKAEVYVKNPVSWRDWIKQKTRTHKSHSKIDKYVDTITTPKIKTFKTESKGIFWLLKYPQTFKEFFWTFQLIIARGYTWIKYFFDTNVLEKGYKDGWERVESTK